MEKKISTQKALTTRFGNVSTGICTDFKPMKGLVVLNKHILSAQRLRPKSPCVHKKLSVSDCLERIDIGEKRHGDSFVLENRQLANLSML